MSIGTDLLRPHPDRRRVPPQAPSSSLPRYRAAATVGIVHPLETLHLGDLVQLPDGRQATARSRVKLPMPLGSMAGFVICGELEMLLSVPPTETGSVLAYSPLDYLPSSARTARAVFSGACSYWAPHLAAQRLGMGELLYKVLEVPGSVNPVVICWRSREAVIFVSGESVAGGVKVLYMPRDQEDLSQVDWRSSKVIPSTLVPDTPAEISQPQRVPEPARGR